MSRRDLLDRLERAAAHLDVVQLPMVFVGGSTMALYVEGAVGEVLRDTKDVDVMVAASPGRFLAAKIAALADRGGVHWYESPDFEDIVLLLESHPQLGRWLAGTPSDVGAAVAAWADAASRRPGVREEIEATVTRGPGMDRRVEAVFDSLLWLAAAWLPRADE